MCQFPVRSAAIGLNYRPLSDADTVPGTEVAGKLAVALVNTARIFEVFVSVILVREHPATSLTLKALIACARQAKK